MEKNTKIPQQLKEITQKEKSAAYYQKNKERIKRKYFTNSCKGCGKAIHFSATNCHSCAMKGEGNTMFNVRLENSPAWKGGVSFGDYGFEFRRSLRNKVKQRDGFSCTKCGDKKRLIPHHIDFNKKNNKLNNLTTLCQSCHSKLHSERRTRIKNGRFA